MNSAAALVHRRRVFEHFVNASLLCPCSRHLCTFAGSLGSNLGDVTGTGFQDRFELLMHAQFLIYHCGLAARLPVLQVQGIQIITFVGEGN